MSNSDKGTTLVPFLNMVTLPYEGIAENITEAVVEGHVDPVQMYIALKRMEKVLKLTIDSQDGNKELKEIFKNAVRKSLDGGKSLEMFGANLRMQATGTWYDFSNCNDSVLNELYKIQEQVKELVKTRENEIKALLPPDDNKKLGIRTRTIIQTGFPTFTIDENEWEDVISPPIKNAGESIIVTFKKQ